VPAFLWSHPLLLVAFGGFAMMSSFVVDDDDVVSGCPFGSNKNKAQQWQ